MSRLRTPIHGFLMFVLLAGIAQTQEITFRDPLEIRGEDPATNLRFRAGWDGESAQWFQLESDGVVIRVRLGTGPGRKWFVIESRGAVPSGPVRLAPSDTATLRRLMASLRPMESSLEGGFVRVVNLLASWPAELPVAGPVMPPPVDISRPVVRLRSEQAIGRAQYPRTTGLARPFHVNLTDWRLLRYALAVAVALLVIAFVPDLVRQGRSEKLENLVQGAQTSLTAALATNDPARRRELLEDTRRFANEALRIDPEAVTAEQLLQEASADLSAMDAIFDLGPMTTVTTLGRQITGEVSVEAVVVAGGSAYLLDVKGGRIISVPLAAAGPPAVVYQEGVAYGGMPAKEPLYVAWDATGAGRLLVLDAERKLFALRPASLPEPLALRRTNTWASIGGIAAYDGNLYVLDPKGNQVHRYLPAASGFDSEPSAVLSAGELGSAQGLAVDGDIYVYFKDGSVRRFRGGEDVGFGLGGIDRLPERAVDLALLSAADEVYIADSGNKRVVVAGTDGTFRRQLVSNAFTDLRAIAVDAAGGQLYVVVGDALLTAALVR